jgi:hypothetical protein
VFYIEETLLALPVIGIAKVHVEVPDAGGFAALSERGLFVYDWSDLHRPAAAALNAYELVASPSAILRVDALPQALRGLAALLQGSAFGEPKLKAW